MYELYIQDTDNDWQLADLGSEKPAINIQRNDIGEMKDRQTDYSQAVKLPKSPTNCRIFSFINEFTVVSDLRHRRMNCRLYADGYIIVGNGAYLKFVSIVENSFNIQIVGSLASFFTKLKALNANETQITLNDLNFTEVINRGYSGFVASNPANNRHSFFAIADYYSGANSRNLSMNKEAYWVGQAFQYPFVKFKSIIEKILSENGIDRLESDITSELEYTNSCIPFDGLKPDINSLSGASIFSNTKYYVSAPGETIMKAVSSKDEFGEFRAIVSGYFEYSDGTYTCKFKVPTDGTYSFLFKIDGSTSGITALIAYYDDTSAGAVGYWNGSNSTEISLNLSKNLSVSNVDYINFKLILDSFSPVVASSLTVNSFSIELQSIKIATNSKAAVGIDMPIKTNLPDITQEDFFKSFLQLFGLTVDIDVDSNTLRAYTLNEVIKNKANAPDWSQKYNKGSGTVKFTLGSYAQKNSIEYKEFSNSIDSSSAYTEVSEGLAEYMHNKGVVVYYTNTQGGNTSQLNPSGAFMPDQLEYYVVGVVLDDDDLSLKSKGYIKIDDNTLEKTHTLFDPIFKAAENNTILYGTTNRYRYAKLKRTDLSTFGAGDDPTLLLFRHSADINVVDGNKNVLGSANLYFVSSISPAINAGEEEINLEAQAFISKYYAGLTNNVLNDVRLIEDAELYLTPKDIAEYDPFIPVYIDYYGAYFYVNKIKNFVSGKLTKVDLVRI